MMAGNSKRQGAIRKKPGGNPTAGSGGRRRKGLEGGGPTPKAAKREGQKLTARVAPLTPSGAKPLLVAGRERAPLSEWRVATLWWKRCERPFP